MKNSFFGIFKKKNSPRGDAVEKVYYAPGEGMSKKTEIVGTAFRGIVVFCGIFGLMHMFFQSVGIYTGQSDYRFYSLTVGYMLLISLVFTVASSVAPVNRVTKIEVPAAVIAALGVIAALTEGNPVTLAENAVRRLYNGFIIGVVREGYAGMAEYTLSENYSFSEEALIKWGVIIFAAILAVMFYFSVTRRTNVILYIITVAPVIGLTFFFNILKGNLGFAFTVASIAGFLSMRIVDSRYGGGIDKREARRRLAAEARAEREAGAAEKKIARLRLKTTADKVYETAIDAEMGARRARLAKRSIYARAREEERRAKEAERERVKAERALQKEKKKQERLRAAREKAARAERIKKENSLPPEEKSAARAQRLKDERERSARLKSEGARIKKEKKERRIEESRRRRRNRAAGGFAAVAAAAVALIATLLPFAISKNPFPKIEFIDNVMNKFRSSATDFLVGDGVDLTRNPYGAYEMFDYETIDFSPRNFNGTQIFRVEAPTAKTVYLKSRTALDYDLANDTWTFATSDDVLDMNRRFGKQFTPDVLTYNAYRYLYPISAETPSRFGTINLSANGFSVEQVHVIRANGASGILFVPSVMNPVLGIRDYKTTDEADGKYTAFYDGVYTSRYYGVGEGYSTISYVYGLGTDSSGVIEREQAELELAYEIASRSDAGASDEELLKYYRETGVESDLIDRYFKEMSSSERGDLLDALTLEREYREYVGETYTTPSGSDRIAELSSQIISNAAPGGSALSRYDTVMAVIKYLDYSENYTYTLTPDMMTDYLQRGSAIEAFIFDVKQGYCSHFATAAALLLRDAGVPVRLAEGYHVSDFFTAGGTGSVDRYASNVRDRNSHTWIEVYFDDIGWIPFEATRTFSEYNFSNTSGNTTPVDNPDDNTGDVNHDDTPETDDAVTPDDTDKADDNTNKSAVVGLDLEVLWARYKKYFIAALVVLLAAAALYIAVRLFMKSAERISYKRQERIRKIKDEGSYRKDSHERRGDAKYLIDSLFTIFSSLDIGPEKGERLSEFARRLKEDYRGLSPEDPEEVAECIMKEEYGHGLTYKETVLLASYLEDVIKTVYAGLNRRERIKYRYFKRIL